MELINLDIKWNIGIPEWWYQDKARGFVIIDTSYGLKNRLVRDYHLVRIHKISNGYMRTIDGVFDFDQDPIIYYSESPINIRYPHDGTKTTKSSTRNT